MHFFALGSSTADKLKERSEEDEDEELIFVSDRSFGGARFRGVEARKYLNTLGTLIIGPSRNPTMSNLTVRVRSL